MTLLRGGSKDIGYKRGVAATNSTGIDQHLRQVVRLLSVNSMLSARECVYRILESVLGSEPFMRLAAFTFCLFAAATAAEAMPVTYAFSGTVTTIGANQVGPKVAVGQQIQIRLSVEKDHVVNPNAPPTYSYGLPFNPTGPLDGPVVSSALFNNAEAAGLFQNVSIGGGSISFSTFSPQTGFGFDLALGGGVAGVFPGNVFPTAINAGDFNFGTFTVNQAFGAQNFGYSGVINGLRSATTAPVPEPMTMAVLGMALAGLVVARRRSA